jgi:hypothetical protein
LAKLLPPGVVTTTLVVPAEPVGVVAVIEVELTTVRLVTVAPPIVTAVAPVKPVPVIVTDCPPASGPDDGLTAVTSGPTGNTYAAPEAEAELSLWFPPIPTALLPPWFAPTTTVSPEIATESPK